MPVVTRSAVVFFLAAVLAAACSHGNSGTTFTPGTAFALTCIQYQHLDDTDQQRFVRFIYPTLRNLLRSQGDLPRSAEPVMTAPVAPSPRLRAELRKDLHDMCAAPGQAPVRVEVSIANLYSQGAVPWPT